MNLCSFFFQNIELCAVYGMALFYIAGTINKDFSLLKTVFINILFSSVLFGVLYLKDEKKAFSSYNIFSILYLVSLITSTYILLEVIIFVLKKVFKKRSSSFKIKGFDGNGKDKSIFDDSKLDDIESRIISKNKEGKISSTDIVRNDDLKEVILKSNSEILESLKNEIKKIDENFVSKEDMSKIVRTQNIQTERHIALEKKMLNLREDMQSFVNRITKLVELINTSSNGKL